MHLLSDEWGVGFCLASWLDCVVLPVQGEEYSCATRFS